MSWDIRPIIRSEISGKVYPDTKQGRDQMDRDEGRIRIPNSALEAMVTLQASLALAWKAAESMTPFVKKTGAGKMLKCHIAGMRRSIRDMLCKVSASQNRTLQANTNLVSITVSSSRVPAMINIDVDDMEHICNRALEMCGLMCTCTREESKDCRLRHAFEQVASGRVETIREDATKCPYAGASLDVTEEV